MTDATGKFMILANFLGGILFLIGSARFILIDDLLGAVVFILAGCIAVAFSWINYRRLNRG